MKHLQIKIQKSLISYVTKYQKWPSSISVLMEEMGESKSFFYEHYSSLLKVEQDIWSSFFDETLESVKNEEVYPQYSSFEETLSFLFTMLEVAKPHREFIQISFKKEIRLTPSLYPTFLDTYLSALDSYTNELIYKGIENNEILNRPLLSKSYNSFFLLQNYAVIQYWQKDKSEDFENTDAFIEKTTTLIYQLMGETPIDTAFDLLKFLYQSI